MKVHRKSGMECVFEEKRNDANHLFEMRILNIFSKMNDHRYQITVRFTIPY